MLAVGLLSPLSRCVFHRLPSILSSEVVLFQIRQECFKSLELAGFVGVVTRYRVSMSLSRSDVRVGDVVEAEGECIGILTWVEHSTVVGSKQTVAVLEAVSRIRDKHLGLIMATEEE